MNVQPRILALALCFASTAGCLVGAQGGVYRGTIPAPASWEIVQVDGGSLTLRIPAAPAIQHGEEEDFDGTPLRFTLGRLETNRVLFGFTVLSAEGGFIEDPYERASQVASGADDGEKSWSVRWEEAYTRNGFRMADRIVDSPQHGASIRFHFVEGKTRIYALFAGYPTQLEAEVAGTVQAYMDGATFPATEATIPQGDGVLAADRWQQIAPPGRDFAASLPGAATWKRDENYLKGAEAHFYEVASESGDSGYRIAIFEFGDSRSDDAFERVRAVTAASGNVTNESYVHQRGYAGLSATLESPERNTLVHYYATASRIYVVSYFAPPDSFDPGADAVARFLHSFRIF